MNVISAFFLSFPFLLIFIFYVFFAYIILLIPQWPSCRHRHRHK